MKTYNTIVTSKEVNVLANVVARAPYECVKLDEGKYGFMDNENGDIRNYFCDTLGYECSNYEAFDFEYFDEPQSVEPSKPNHKTHLQGLGKVPAIKAGELKEGDIIVCNYGYTQTVTRIIKETAKSIFVEIRSDESGKLYETRYLKSRLIAIKERESISLPEPSKEIDITGVLEEVGGNPVIKEIHISEIKPGDTILHTDGKLRTVCKNNIKRGFSGITLFGDPYKLGIEPVKKVIIKN